MHDMHDLFTDQKENDIFNNEIRKGFLKMILMKIIQEKPTHGYEIIQLIKEKSCGRWTPSPGSIYPALEYLVSRGYVTSEEIERKKVYTITPKGEQVIEQMKKKRDEMIKELTTFLGDL
jgi:DNA-binding PadR family transcriptional regulator